MAGNLSGKVAVVTGASRGIGKAIALALGAEGARIVIAARSEQARQLEGTIYRTAREIEAFGGEAFPIKVDLSKDEEIDRLFDEVATKWDGVDILINNAAVNPTGLLVEIPERLWDRAIQVNLRAAFRCARLAFPYMKSRSWGHIINVCSARAHEVYEGGTTYIVTKLALEAFTEGLGVELSPFGVAVNGIAPDLTDTEGIRLHFPDVDRSEWQQPIDWGRRVRFLVSRSPAEMTGRILQAHQLDDLMRHGGDSLA